MLKRGDRIGLVCCSDGHSSKRMESNQQLEKALRNLGLIPVWSPYIYAKTDCFSGTGQERAEAVHTFYEDPSIRAIFDLSGGNVGNHVLEYLDYEKIRENPKPFFGYSDLTTVLHGIYTQTGQPVFLYQLRNLVSSGGSLQQSWFVESLMGTSSVLFQPTYTFLRGSKISSTVVGGNLRCLLKLAGTRYFPDCTGKVLFLEALGGGLAEISAMAVQLRQMGVFQQISGLLLGTFTKLEEQYGSDAVKELFLQVTESCPIPIAKTVQIGHAPDSKALQIGVPILLEAK